VAPEEIDVSLDELENRLDRLRSLYEQYFLGIEKIEPGVARKDVDRRFWLLRRVHIRNTARRFRLQVLIQRYNTFQQHWARICREIENGTYTRHLLRAQKHLGEEPKTWAAKKRLGYFRKRAGDNGSAGDQPDAGGDDLAALLDGGADLAAEAARAAEAAIASANVRAEAARAFEAAVTSSEARAQAPLAMARGRAQLDILDLDLDDDLGGSSPPPPPRPHVPPPKAPIAPAVTQPRPIPKPQDRPAPAAIGAPAPPIAPPARIRTPASPPAAQDTTPAKVAPAPLPRPPATAARPPAAAPAGKPAPAPRPALAAPPPPVASQRDALVGVSEARLKQLHAELSDAKRRLNQSDAVSFDALAKGLRDSEKRIRAQHPGRTIDFHVVVKDGKPIVKPIVRK